ncbi:hypothetical protein BJ912DRAFT_959825 [Pholiota molesta]|nr:hypothetical protein BJ912DRAFT_959825 [Pholiota molesta]
MHFFASLALAVSTLAALVSGTNHSVVVGQNNQLTFEPNTLTGVQAGDFVSFKFVSKNHTVTQSTFAAPCAVKDGGVNSGYIPVAANATAFPEWTIQIDNATSPLWFFCEQGAHCKAGMVFAINPTADKSFSAFLATAQGSTPNTSATGTTPAGTAATPVTTNGSSTDIISDPSSTGSATTSSGVLHLSAQTAGSLLAAMGAAIALAL